MSVTITHGSRVAVNGQQGEVIAIGRPPRGSKRITADTRLVIRLADGSALHTLAGEATPTAAEQDAAAEASSFRAVLLRTALDLGTAPDNCQQCGNFLDEDAVHVKHARIQAWYCASCARTLGYTK